MHSFTKIILSVLAAASLGSVAAAPLEQQRRGDAACGVHVQRRYDGNTNIVKVHAPDGYPGPNVIGNGGGNINDGFSVSVPDMGMGPLYLVINANDANQGGVIRFGYGADIWLSSDSRCSVGEWDSGCGIFDACDVNAQTQDMDCSFSCT